MQVIKSELINFQLGTITERHVFLLVKCVPIHFLGKEVLEAYNKVK